VSFMRVCRLCTVDTLDHQESECVCIEAVEQSVQCDESEVLESSVVRFQYRSQFEAEYNQRGTRRRGWRPPRQRHEVRARARYTEEHYHRKKKQKPNVSALHHQITLSMHLIDHPLPVPIKIGRLVLGLVRAAVADGERGAAMRVRVGGEPGCKLAQYHEVKGSSEISISSRLDRRLKGNEGRVEEVGNKADAAERLTKSQPRAEARNVAMKRTQAKDANSSPSSPLSPPSLNHPLPLSKPPASLRSSPLSPFVQQQRFPRSKTAKIAPHPSIPIYQTPALLCEGEERVEPFGRWAGALECVARARGNWRGLAPDGAPGCGCSSCTLPCAGGNVFSPCAPGTIGCA
jgi:hypothetical protein